MEKKTREYDPYEKYTEEVKFGVYDKANNDMICKTPTKTEARETIKELKEIDKEIGIKHKYYITKLKEVS